MAEYDGEIIISASIDTKEFSKDADKLTKKLDMQTEAVERQKIVVERLIDTYDLLKQASLKKFKSEDLFDDKTISRLHNLRQQIDLALMRETRLNDELAKTKEELSNIGKSARNIDFSSSFSGLKNKINDIVDGVSRFSRRIFNLASSAFIFNIISKGFREISSGINTVISKDAALSSSLTIIKTNLFTAFAPIYQAILPALRALGQMLSVVTLKLASFISMLFGKTLQQSQALAGDLIQTINNSERTSSSLKKQSKSIDKLANSTKKAGRELASFDKLNVLLKKDSDKVGKEISSAPDITGGGDKIKFTPLFAGINEEQVNSLAETIERLKKPFKDLDFSRLNESLSNLKSTLGRFAKREGEGLWWLYENVLAPLSGFTITEVLPRFLNILNESLKAFEPLDEQIRADLEFLWKEFLEPIAKWTGGKIIEFLDWLDDSIGDLGTSLSENRPLLEFLSAFLIGLGSAIVLKGIGSLLAQLPVLIGMIYGLADAMVAALISNPWILIIAGIITAIILIAKHWDILGQYFDTALDSFKGAIKGIGEFLSGFVEQVSGWIELIAGLLTWDWDRVWQGAVKIVSGAVNSITGMINFFSGIISGIASGIIGVINFLIDQINGFSFQLPDWLGGGTFSAHLPKIPTYQIPRIPRLAQGAVLEGGDPMLAYLNDQPRGQTNIETPLNTMIEAFNSALSNRPTGNVTIEANGDINQLISFLNLKLKQENERIGGRMVKGDVWI